MSKTQEIAMLWNSSHIWGYLLWHGLKSLNLDFTVITDKEIKENSLSGKLLFVPGGSAKQKSLGLKKEGCSEIKNFVAKGGTYIGFCGGAGLGLSTHEGLGLCPWGRSTIHERILHHISGNMYVELGKSHFVPENSFEPTLPVWFPARFAKEENTKHIENKVHILASYTNPTKDVFMSDLPLGLFPPSLMEESYALYGTYLNPDLYGQAAVIQGDYHKGQYILSYSHLETPNSAFANSFLCKIISETTSQKGSSIIPSLDLENLPILWEDKELKNTYTDLKTLLSIGLELNLLFYRNSWLYGWKSGLQGIQLGNLRIAMALLLAQKPTLLSIKAWKSHKEKFLNLFQLFFSGTTHFLYGKRLHMTVPEILPLQFFNDQQYTLFGKAMDLGGICGDLVEIIEAIWLCTLEN